MAHTSTHESSSDQLPKIRLLKNRRRTFKAQITSFGKALETYQDSPKDRVKLRERIERLRRQFDGFNEVQDELGLIENFEQTETERETVTDHYDEVIATAITLLQEAEQSTTQHPATAPRIANESPALSTSSATIGVHLPKIDLPKFDGRLEKWVTFKDAFQTMIHSHPGLSDIQKLNYLRLSLSGKAESSIESFTISEENYKAAWDQLIETYDNTRALVLRHAALLRDTPAMPDDTSESIRDLVNHMQSHIRSLNALGRSWEDIASDLLTSIAISKLAPRTQRTWEQTLIDTNMPKIADVFKHLRNASHRSEGDDSPSNSNRNQRANQTWERSINRPERGIPQVKKSPSSPRAKHRQTFVTTSTPTSNCRICHADSHAIYRCQKFLEMKPNDRMQSVKKAKLCQNCLLSDHATDDCKAGGCRVCNGRHNTKLHHEPSLQEDRI